MVVNNYSFKTLYGELIIAEFDGQICLCDWRFQKMRQAVNKRMEQFLGCSFYYRGPVYGEVPAPIFRLCGQLQEYFAARRHDFDINFLTAGSVFQNSIWSELINVPYGKTISYAELARRVNRADAVRAAAVGANALSFLVPCHRVIRMSGDLAGYAGGVNIKKKILAMESWQTAASLQDAAEQKDEARSMSEITSG